MSFISRILAATLGTFGTLGRFLVSGGTAALVLLALLYIFTDVLGVWYLTSSVVALLFAFATSFTLHKFWTFKDAHLGRIPKQLTSHVVVGIANLLLNTGLLYLFVEKFRIHYLFSQVIVSAMLAIASFFIYKHVIFHQGLAGARPDGGGAM